MPSRVAGLTRGTIATAPSVCRECVWWQSRGNRTASKERWIERAEEESGEWGTIYYDDDGSVARLDAVRGLRAVPRAADLPAGPPSDDAVLVTCAYLTREGPMGAQVALPRRHRGGARPGCRSALEAFAYRYSEREPARTRFIVHRTVFPRDFLEEFGFSTLRAQGRVELCRLELAGLAPVEEGRRARVLRVVQEAFRLRRAPQCRRGERRLVRPLTTSDRKEHRCETPHDCKSIWSGVSRNDHFRWNVVGRPTRVTGTAPSRRR